MASGMGGGTISSNEQIFVERYRPGPTLNVRNTAVTR